MKTDDIRKLLEEKRDRLVRRVAQISSELRSRGSQDSGEWAIETENHQVLERLDESERRELEEIEEALERIQKGTYTQCARCGGTIQEKRLEALPYANLCVKCAS